VFSFRQERFPSAGNRDWRNVALPVEATTYPMRPLLHPSLVNGRLGDPALYIETLFEKRAIMFDLGDISNLPPRKVQRLEHVFVSHAHIDHFIGFDHLLRMLVGREKTIRLYGPSGFIDQVQHKLLAYRWNLVNRFMFDLVFVVTEVDCNLAVRTARLHLKNAFAVQAADCGRLADGILCSEPTFRVTTGVLDHRTACLGFAIEETAHINVWKNRLSELRLPVGPWLRELKRAVIENRRDDYPIYVGLRSKTSDERAMPLGELRSVVTVTPGQKIGYVTDVADTVANRQTIVRLVRNADVLFIEAAFANADVELAAERAHLTTTAAGSIAREAAVRRVEPFHFSPRYSGQEARLLDEVMLAFAGHFRCGSSA
jgi:ribonuclease Z